MHQPVLRAVTPYVLVGGRSTRMGRDKAFLPWQGRTLLQHSMDRVACLGAVRLLSGDAQMTDRAAQLAPFGMLVPDRLPNAGPLGGIDAALHDVPTEWLLIVPVDQPYLPSTAFMSLVAEVERSRAEAAWFTQPAGAEPLPLLLHRSLRDGICAALGRGERRVLPTVQAVALHTYQAFRSQSEWFRNLNSPADVTSAESADG